MNEISEWQENDIKKHTIVFGTVTDVAPIVVLDLLWSEGVTMDVSSTS